MLPQYGPFTSNRDLDLGLSQKTPLLFLGGVDVLALLLPEEEWQSRSKSGLTLVVGGRRLRYPRITQINANKDESGLLPKVLISHFSLLTSKLLAVVNH